MLSTNSRRIRFILAMAKSFHMYGAPSYRIEAASKEVAKKLGFKADFFSTPTSLLAAITDHDEYEEFHLMRVEPAITNLNKLELVDEVANKVIEGRDVVDGTQDLNDILDSPDPSNALTVLSYAVLSLNICLFLNGGLWDTVVSTIIGLIIGFITVKNNSENLKHLNEGLAAFIATVLSYIAFKVNSNVHPPTVILSSLIVLVPGLNFTISISELATNNLTSGTARLMGAIMVFLKLTFGVYAGSALANMITLPIAGDFTSYPLPIWVRYLIFPVTSLAFVVTFKANKKQIFPIFLAGLVAVTSSTLLMMKFDRLASVFMSSMIISMLSNFYARKFNRTSLMMLLPGIIFLVPGAFGFKSMSQILNKDILVGIETALESIKIAMSLVAGFFFGNVIVNPRKSL